MTVWLDICIECSVNITVLTAFPWQCKELTFQLQVAGANCTAARVPAVGAERCHLASDGRTLPSGIYKVAIWHLGRCYITCYITPCISSQLLPRATCLAAVAFLCGHGEGRSGRYHQNIISSIRMKCSSFLISHRVVLQSGDLIQCSWSFRSFIFETDSPFLVSICTISRFVCS